VACATPIPLTQAVFLCAPRTPAGSCAGSAKAVGVRSPWGDQPTDLVPFTLARETQIADAISSLAKSRHVLAVTVIYYAALALLSVALTLEFT